MFANEERFRKSALRKLKSPEQTDSMLVFVKPAQWQILTAVALVLLALVSWSLGGSVSTKVQGRGILLAEEGASSVYFAGNGDIARIIVTGDQLVSADQILAVLNQPEISRDIGESERRISLLQKYRENLASGESRMDLEVMLIDEETRLESLKAKMSSESEVRSPIAGRVLEIYRSQGQPVKRGDTLLSLEPEDADSRVLGVLGYVSAEEGKKISCGMEAYVSPSTARPEEYGMMVGKVTRISPLPVSSEAMARVLGNLELVRALSMGEASIEISIALDLAETPSGYRWTSSDGAPIKLTRGTLCRISIPVQQMRPISLILPYIEKIFFSSGQGEK